MDILTDAERTALNTAMEIILRHTPTKASWQLGPQNHHGKPNCSVTYFDTNGEHHSQIVGEAIYGGSFADRIECALRIQREADGNADKCRDRRRERLLAELAALDLEA